MNIRPRLLRLVFASLAILLLVGSDLRAQSLPARLDTVSAWGGSVNAFQRVGNIGYCGSGQRFVVLDMSDETNIHEITSLHLQGTVEDIVVAGDYAYVGTEGLPMPLVAVDVTTPSAPHVTWAETSFFAPTPSPRRLRVYGSLLYVAGNGGSMAVYAIENPAHPTLVRIDNADTIGTLNTNVVDFCIREDLMYVADSGGNLRIYTLQPDPLHPALLGSVQVSTSTQPALCVSVDGSRALVQYQEFISGQPIQYRSRMIDITNPSNPALLGTSYGDFATATRSVLVGECALVADASGPGSCGGNDRGLAIIDFSDPFSPTLVAHYVTPYSATRDVRVQGNRAYLFDDGQGLVVVDITGGFNPPPAQLFLSAYFSPGLIRDCCKSGNRLYVTDAWNGFTVLDVSNANAIPVPLGVYHTPAINSQGFHGGDHHNIVVRGNLAYLAGGASGIDIVDVTDPAAMNSVATILPLNDLNYIAWSIDLDGDVLHASITTGGCVLFTTKELRNYDISLPANPVELGRVAAGSPTVAMATKSGVALLGNSTNHKSLYSFDCTNPATPNLVTTTTAGGEDLALAGDILLAARPFPATPSSANGMYIMSVSDPLHPQQVGFVSGNGDGRAVAILGNRAYFSGKRTSLRYPSIQVFNISNPASPQFLAYSNAFPYKVRADGDYIYATSGVYSPAAAFNQGLIIQHYHCAADFDGNGAVEPADIASFVNEWFSALQQSTPAALTPADFDGNGTVEPADIASFVNAWFNALTTGCS